MDLHELLAEWLVGGGEGDPPRDVAVHASTCDDCMRAIAAFDSLQAIDPGAASLPPLLTGAPDRATPFGAARVVIGSLAVILLAASLSIGASGLMRTSEPVAQAGATPAGSVLAGAPSPRPTERLPTPTSAESPTPSQSASPSATDDPIVADAPLAPTQAPPPPTAAPPPPPPTVPPPSSTAPPQTPAPTPTPDNDNPVAVDDSYAAVAGVAASGNVLANDSDPDDDVLTVVAWEAPSSGAFVSTDPNGTFSFLADATFEGTVTFTYTVGDGRGGTDVGTATIQVSLPLP